MNENNPTPVEVFADDHQKVCYQLNSAMDELSKSIANCDQEIAKWEEKKEFLCEKLQVALDQIQGKLKKKVTKREGPTVRELIQEYIQTNQQVDTKDIKQFLESKGKNTNPGVELSRMIKDKLLKCVERGVYTKV